MLFAVISGAEPQHFSKFTQLNWVQSKLYIKIMGQLNTDEKIVLPSRFQPDDAVTVDFTQDRKFTGVVTGVHFYKSKVKYDVDLVITNFVHGDPETGNPEETTIRTRIYNVDSAFVFKG